MVNALVSTLVVHFQVLSSVNVLCSEMKGTLLK